MRNGSGLLRRHRLAQQDCDAHLRPQAYLVCERTSNGDLSDIPNVGIVACLAPYFIQRPGTSPGIYIECSNGLSIHVVPKLQTRARGSWISRTKQTSLGSLRDGTGGHLGIHEMT